MRAIREARKMAKELGVSGSRGVVGGKVCDDESNCRKRKSKKCECYAMLYGSLNREKERVVRKVVLKHLRLFLHAQHVDEEGWLKDVFWVGGRSRVAYEELGYMVCFDATYLTNEHEPPFVNFVCVNHHGQSLLLGCALVSHEDYDTFKWIFKKWLSSMNNQAPVAILTDQAAAIVKGKCGFVNRNAKIFEFPLKYSKALEKWTRDESNEDANFSKYLRRLVSGFEVEKLFQKLYTDTKFQEIQTECARMMYCFCLEERFIEDTIILYIEEDRVWVVPEGLSEENLIDRRRFYFATFNTVTKDVLCDCRKFQTDGIMCKHMIQILDQNHVLDIMEKYIVNRWRKDIIRKHTCVKVEYHDPS
ncbi:protein FAR1-RELATED SEQUENCE 8-like [Chenopodium quinoa]|uniref:protein FAR1-RELATED SEQUENCE 8-like n=1 Tax=Chenopodium quinoa TaxID=63459 RepID=UPI000B793089|nr:protein FAR1-RELATED SEQUENCE 8-like [Chenopodium quinoa]